MYAEDFTYIFNKYRAVTATVKWAIYLIGEVKPIPFSYYSPLVFSMPTKVAALDHAKKYGLQYAVLVSSGFEGIQIQMKADGHPYNRASAYLWSFTVKDFVGDCLNVALHDFIALRQHFDSWNYAIIAANKGQQYALYARLNSNFRYSCVELFSSEAFDTEKLHSHPVLNAIERIALGENVGVLTQCKTKCELSPALYELVPEAVKDYANVVAYKDGKPYYVTPKFVKGEVRINELFV